MCGRYVITNAVSKTSKIVKTAIKVEDLQKIIMHILTKNFQLLRSITMEILLKI